MSVGKHIVGLKAVNGDDILDMDANWTSKWYPFGYFAHLAVQLKWDDPLVEGTLYLDYTADPDAATDVYTVKNNVLLDGTFDEMLFLDSNLPVVSYRLRFEHSSGSADLLAFHNYKRGE